jgi:hypothetical protein
VSSGNLKRAVRGYGVGAGVVVVAASAALGPFFPWGLVVGTVLAVVIGIFVVLPACLLLHRLGQLRPWWAALMGAVALILPLLVLNADLIGVNYQGVDRRYVVVEVAPNGRLTPNWPALGIMAAGAAAGLIGWAAAYGFRTRPPLPEAPAGTRGDA